MSEPTAQPTANLSTTTNHPSQDVLLQDLVEMLNAIDDETGSPGEFGFPVTLAVPGGLISGTAIGYSGWLKLFGEQWKASLDAAPSLGSTMQKRYSDIDSLRHAATYGDGPLPLPAYIHLKDAHVVFGSLLVPSHGDGFLWRGRISEVGGFSFGALTSQH